MVTFIRILGSLLSAHLIITDPHQTLGQFAPDNYNNELLHLAHDLATRLLPAFENTTTGLPHPRVSKTQMRGILYNIVMMIQSSNFIELLLLLDKSLSWYTT